MRRARGWALALAAWAVALSACAFGLSRAAHAGELEGRLYIAGEERRFLMVTPPGAGSRRLPVVFALHGALMNGRSMQRSFALDAIAREEGFIAVYPDGRNRVWNDGRPMPWYRGAAARRDDVGFLIKLARQLVEDGLADPARLYLLGVSNGGLMAFRMACEAPGTFAAYAAIIANMPAQLAETCRPSRGVPMMIMNATDDPLMPWDGGPLGFAGRRSRLVSTEESLEFWRRNNGCEGARQEKPLPDKDPRDGSTVLAEQYEHCRSGAPVVLIALKGSGHVPPGTTFAGRPIIEAVLGKANRDISAADISWKFFRRFPRLQ